MTTTTFAGIPFGGRWDVRRAWNNYQTLFSGTNRSQTISDGPYVLFTAPRTAPDVHGEENYAGILSGHVSRFGTDSAFTSECPQILNTLVGVLPAITVEQEEDAGGLRIDVAGVTATELGNKLKVGRFINLGADRLLYKVAAVLGTVIHIDIPLPRTIAAGTIINVTPTARWLWTDRMVNEGMPQYDGVWWRGFIEARESV